MAQENINKGEKKHPITYFLDGDLKTTIEKSLTPNQILSGAGIDSATHYLKWITGDSQHTSQGKGDESFQIHEGMKFVSIYNGPMTVS